MSAFIVTSLTLMMTFCGRCYGNEFRCANVSSVSINVQTQPILNQVEASFLLILGFGGFSVLLAVLYVFIRRSVFHDHNNLDSTFDAGGNVSASLSAVTIASQMLWPADLMQSVTIVVKYGIAGGFWYCSSCLFSVSLFPLLSFKFKTRAPGAKTYLQVILARFGQPAHLLFCVFALMVNVIIVSAIIVSWIAVLSMTVKDVSPEYCLIVLATLCGSYSFIGGLGSTFYVSYFNAVATCVVLATLIINIFYLDTPPFGSLEEIYEKVNCLAPVAGNKGGSYFTFLSEGSVLFAVQGLVLATCIVYCDQANWQSRIAAKPLQGAIGFLVGGFIWFSIPASISMVTALTYLAESATDSSKSLSMDQIDSGIVSTYMSEAALGRQGGIMMLTMLTMLTMSTGSSEIMGVSSIIVYDIYQTYIRPYRSRLSPSHCVFCGQFKHKVSQDMLSMAHDDTDPVCTCPAVETCQPCQADTQAQLTRSNQPGKLVKYTCKYHRGYRAYQDGLIEFKNWCILWITLALIPFGLILNSSGLDLNWIMMVAGTVTVPAFPGVVLSILWSRLTGRGIIIGSLCGLICGIVSIHIVALTYYKGRGGYLIATSELYSVVSGSCVALTVTVTLTILVSLCTHQVLTKEDEVREWEKMRAIDNPLNPWAAQFAKEFPEVMKGKSCPSNKQLEWVSKKGRLVAIAGSVIFFILFIVIIPGSMATLEVLSNDQFVSWAQFINIWFFIMSVLIIVVTPLEEIKTIWQHLKQKKIQPSLSSANGGNRLDYLGETGSVVSEDDSIRLRL